MHWMSVKLPDNFQMREHSWQCRFHIKYKILTNSNQQTLSYKFTSHTIAFLSVVLITEMLEICIQTSYDQKVQLILKSYLAVVYDTPLTPPLFIEVLVPNQESGQSCACVFVISVLLLSTIFSIGSSICSDSLFILVFHFITHSTLNVKGIFK